MAWCNVSHLCQHLEDAAGTLDWGPVHSSSPAGSATPRSRHSPDEHRQSRSASRAETTVSSGRSTSRSRRTSRNTRAALSSRSRGGPRAGGGTRLPMSTSHRVSSTARNAGSTCGDTSYSNAGKAALDAAAGTRPPIPQLSGPRPASSPVPRIVALSTLGLMRARAAIRRPGPRSRKHGHWPKGPPSFSGWSRLPLLAPRRPAPGLLREVAPSTQATFELALEK